MEAGRTMHGHNRRTARKAGEQPKSGPDANPNTPIYLRFA